MTAPLHHAPLHHAPVHEAHRAAALAALYLGGGLTPADLPDMADPYRRQAERVAQAIADAEARGEATARASFDPLEGAVWCPDCGADLEDWRGHRTDPPCPHDPDRDPTPEETR